MPDKARLPYFDGWETKNATYRAHCAECKAEIAISFSLVQNGAWGWRERFSEEEIETVENFFGIQAGRQTPPKPWPSVSTIECPACRTAYIFYAEYDEYRNSVFRLTAQGLAYRDAQPFSQQHSPR